MPAQKSYLKRLPEGYYTGHAIIHWSMTLEDRATGWLNDSFHQSFREILLHASTRHRVIVPCYCLMPDHIHLLSAGISEKANHKLCIQFLRRHVNSVLKTKGFELQSQPYDHVLDENERKRGSFQIVTHYILDNPVRKGLVPVANQWPYSGALVSGYPDLNPHDTSFWNRFWKIYEKEIGTT